MSIGALKFFQAYINEMIEVGGENLPRTISTKLGSKLAKIYKSRGINDIEMALKQMYKVMNGSPKIKKVDDNNFEVTLEYPERFCPIGGKYNPERAEFFQQALCYPFIKSFLNELNPSFNYNVKIDKCILSSIKGYCLYSLQLEEKVK